MWSSVVAVVGRPSGYTARSWPRSWSRSRGRPPVGPMVAATGRLLPLGSLVAVAGQVAQATNGAVGVAAGLPLFKRGVLAVRLGSECALGVIDLPALPVLHRLPNRAVPGAATLDRGRSFAQLPRPFGPLQLDRAGLRAGAPFVLAHHRVVLGQQLRVGLAVGLVLLLLVADVAFAVGGTVGLLAGDLACLLCLLVLLPRAGEVAPCGATGPDRAPGWRPGCGPAPCDRSPPRVAARLVRVGWWPGRATWTGRVGRRRSCRRAGRGGREGRACS